MLIEYAGELVRRSVADARERRCYDKLVGAGTYVFGLNEDLCVDATQAGDNHCGSLLHMRSLRGNISGWISSCMK